MQSAESPSVTTDKHAQAAPEPVLLAVSRSPAAEAGRWALQSEEGRRQVGLAHSNKTGHRQMPPEAHSLTLRTARRGPARTLDARRLPTDTETTITVNIPPSTVQNALFRRLSLAPSRHSPSHPGRCSSPGDRNARSDTATPATLLAFSYRTGNIAPVSSTTASQTDSPLSLPGRAGRGNSWTQEWRHTTAIITSEVTFPGISRDGRLARSIQQPQCNKCI